MCLAAGPHAYRGQEPEVTGLVSQPQRKFSDAIEQISAVQFIYAIQYHTQGSHL